MHQTILAFLLFLPLWIYQSTFDSAISQSGCPNRTQFLDSSRWDVASQNQNINILWQKTQQRPLLQQFDNYGLVSFQDQVVFYSQYWENKEGGILPSCSFQEIISFDLSSGNIKWRYPLSQQYDRPFENLKALNDGVLIVLDGILIKLDAKGKYIWSNEGFASHEIDVVYQDKDLYLPSKNKIYVVSNDTGLLLNTLDIENPISVESGHIISAIDDQQLRISSSDGQKVFDVHVDDTAPVRNAWIAPFTTSSGDLLLIYDQFGLERSIDAYSLSQGNLIWHSNGYFQGLPVLSGKYLFTYGDSVVNVLDVNTGKIVDSINLIFKDHSQNVLHSYNVLMTANSTALVINIRDTWDLIAMNLDK